MSYRTALLFNAGALTVAIRHHRHHRITRAAWLVLYASAGIQMGWILRPFVRAPGMEETFLREEAFTNAYLVVAGLIFGG